MVVKASVETRRAVRPSGRMEGGQHRDGEMGCSSGSFQHQQWRSLPYQCAQIGATQQRSSVSADGAATRAAVPCGKGEWVTTAARCACSQVLGGFLAGAALTLSGAANAVTPVDVIDDRKARSTGFDLIYGEPLRSPDRHSACTTGHLLCRVPRWHGGHPHA